MSTEEPRRRRTRKKRSFNTVVQMRNERSFIALVRDEPRFRLALGGLVALMVVLAVLVPKIWVTTPKGFFPVVKASGLDLLQSASLRRTARAAGAGGDFGAAAQAWESALANNLADVRNLRGFLGLIASQESPDPRWRFPVIQRSGLLLGITGTNVADLELSARAMERFDLNGWITDNLAPRAADLGPSGQSTLGRAWFRSGDMASFDAWWRAHGESIPGDPGIRLYRDAWQMGWGPAVDAAPARDRLVTATSDPALRVTALRLLLAAQARSLDLAAYEKNLATLVDLGKARLVDHTRRWLLMLAAGRSGEARDAARRATVSPASEAEVVEVTAVWRRLGADDLAAEFAAKGLAEFPDLAPAWLSIAGTFADARRWDDLRVLAQRMRNARGVDVRLAGYSHFLEGLAEDGMERRPRAEQSFDRMLENPPEDPVLNLQAALAMQQRGYPVPAGRLLQSLETDHATDPTYWVRVAANAFETRDADAILHACRRAHELRPDDVALASNYAAALLAARTNAAEAVTLTVDLLARRPDLTAFRLNHALALIQNARHAEGLAALDGIPADSLTPMERSGWNLGRFEALLAAGRVPEARIAASGVDRRDLFGPQAAWFETARASLEGR